MPLLRGKITVECPRLGETVNIRQCLDCPHFSHVSYQGTATPWIACKYAGEEPTAHSKPEIKKAETKRKKEAKKTGLDMFLS